jgi:very-short-patch-repair endonuclease
MSRGIKLTISGFIKNAIKRHGLLYDYSKSEYINAKTDIEIICKVHGIFCQKPYDHLRGRGCPKCGTMRTSAAISMKQDEFIKKANLRHGNFYDYSKVCYINTREKVKIICPVHGEFEQRGQDHLSGYGCYECGKIKISELKLMDISTFIEKAKEKHGDKYDYSKSINNSSKSKIIIICPIHGEFEQSLSDHLKGCGCRKCKISKGVNKIVKILEANNIKFLNEYIFKECKNEKSLRFDFYLPSYNMCIEFDGAQHFRSVEYWGGEEGLKLIRKRDKIKNDFCKENNIKLLRIPYWKIKNIEDIIKGALKGAFGRIR